MVLALYRSCDTRVVFPTLTAASFPPLPCARSCRSPPGAGCAACLLNHPPVSSAAPRRIWSAQGIRFRGGLCRGRFFGHVPPFLSLSSGRPAPRDGLCVRRRGLQWDLQGQKGLRYRGFGIDVPFPGRPTVPAEQTRLGT